MCIIQMIPKRCCAAPTHPELQTTSVPICNALGAAAAHIVGCSATNSKMIPDNRAAATTCPNLQYTHLCNLAEHQPRMGVAPSVQPVGGVVKEPVLHRLVHLREPTRSRCIQLGRENLEQLVGQRGEHSLVRAAPKAVLCGMVYS